MKLGTSRNRIALNAAKNNAELGSSTRKRSVDIELKSALDPLFEKYHSRQYLGSDPIEYPHRFSDPWDCEAVALFSAVLAYGNVTQIRRSIEDLLRRISHLGLRPSEMIRSLEFDAGARAWTLATEGFVHRFNVGADFVLLAELLGKSWKTHGSLGGHLVSHLAPGAKDFGEALTQVFEDWEGWKSDFSPAPPSFDYLVTSPSLGSACKRWCMLLRWMVRNDEIDLGLWRRGSPLLPSESRGVEPTQLVMPLDTHTGRK
jgi:uncharacterized protein (TIGR02757 family)